MQVIPTVKLPIKTLPNGKRGMMVPLANREEQIHSIKAFNHVPPAEIARLLASSDEDKVLVGIETLRAMRVIGSQCQQSFFHLLDNDRPGLDWAIEQTPFKIGREIDSHGIRTTNQLTSYDSLCDILSTGIRSFNAKGRPFYSMPFISAGAFGGAFGADHPFTNGGILITSGYGEKLLTQGVKYVFLGEEFNRLIDYLRNKFPSVGIFPWHEAPMTLTAAANKATGLNLPLPQLTEENWPVYYLPTARFARKIELPAEKPEIPTPTSTEKNNNDPDVW